MKIQYLGTGAAEGVPAMFCNCENCNRIRQIGHTEFRTRSQIIIDDYLSIDFPPEAFAHSLQYNIELSKLKFLLVSHSHMDHFYAHDFILRGYRYAQIAEPKLKIFGNKEVKAVFDECTAREMKEVVAPNIELTVIKPYDIFNVGEYKVIALPANHSKTEDALLFYIEHAGKGYLNFFDTGIVSDDIFDFLADNKAKVNLVSFDCTFLEFTADKTARHMGIENDMIMKQKLIERKIVDENTKYVITHFSHNGNPTRAHLKKIKAEYGVTAAFDGFTIEI